MKTGIKSQIVIVFAVAAVLLIVMSVCAIAESITFEKVAALAASALALNKCCGILLNQGEKIMKNKYKVVALVPLEFSVEGSSDSKEAIESVKNIFEACRNDNDCADIVFDGIEESLRHDSIEYKVEAAQPEPEVKANSDIRSVASDICDVFENYLDENGVYIVCDDADEEQDRKANESGAMLYGMEYWHLVEDVEFRVNHINAQYKLFTVFDIMEAFDKLLISKKLGDFVPSGENRYRLYAKILSCLRSIREKL